MLPEPHFRLDGKVALITGAARGIGLGIARALAGAGCAVAIQDIEEALAKKEAARLIEDGGKAIALGGDLTDPSISPGLVQSTVRNLGGLHILINNGAIQMRQSWLQMPMEEMERELRANLLTVIAISKEAALIFRKQKWGRVINVGSIQSRNGNPNMLPYSISKAGLENLTTGLAQDLARDQVTVNLISPGFFDTIRNLDHFKSQADKDRAGQHIPLGRIGQPEDCGPICVFLCSEGASYITGQSILVDGGISVR